MKKLFWLFCSGIAGLSGSFSWAMGMEENQDPHGIAGPFGLKFIQSSPPSFRVFLDPKMNNPLELMDGCRRYFLGSETYSFSLEILIGYDVSLGEILPYLKNLNINSLSLHLQNKSFGEDFNGSEILKMLPDIPRLRALKLSPNVKKISMPGLIKKFPSLEKVSASLGDLGSEKLPSSLSLLGDREEFQDSLKAFKFLKFLQSQGVKKLKIELDFFPASLKVINALSKVSFQEVALTLNGHSLAANLQAMKEQGLQNLSLSLKEIEFKDLTCCLSSFKELEGLKKLKIDLRLPSFATVLEEVWGRLANQYGQYSMNTARAYLNNNKIFLEKQRSIFNRYQEELKSALNGVQNLEIKIAPSLDGESMPRIYLFGGHSPSSQKPSLKELLGFSPEQPNNLRPRDLQLSPVKTPEKGRIFCPPSSVSKTPGAKKEENLSPQKPQKHKGKFVPFNSKFERTLQELPPLQVSGKKINIEKTPGNPKVKFIPFNSNFKRTPQELPTLQVSRTPVPLLPFEISGGKKSQGKRFGGRAVK